MMHTTQNRMVARSRRITALGVLLAALVAAMLMAAGPAHASTTFTVTNTNDSGAGSLRQAILDANATSGADVINFDIPGTGVKTISPNPELPQITGAVTMDGYSQPGAQPNTKAVGSDAVLKIELSGASADAGTGLYITAANSTVKGLVINRWTHGIILGSSGATGNKIAGNYLGTDAMGTNDLGNDFNGVYVGNASGNTIGGATAGERNVISGNDYYGVNIDGQTATGNRVVGNYVGTDASGTQDLGNHFAGVFSYKSSDNAIGAGRRGSVTLSPATTAKACLSTAPLPAATGSGATTWAPTPRARGTWATPLTACTSAAHRTTPSEARRPGRETSSPATGATACTSRATAPRATACSPTPSSPTSGRA